jgi:hypothetical protein
MTFRKHLPNVSRTFVRNLGLDDRSAYGRDHSWYDLSHTLKAWDVLFNTHYNTSTIVRGGDHNRSRGKNHEFSWWNREHS